MLCEFTLPSNPQLRVQLKEATVADAIEFSAVDPDADERATTVFLQRVQEKETYSDPLLWTGEDRRFAIFMYYVSSTRDRLLSLTYKCAICGKVHAVDIPLADIMAGYREIEGKPFREFPFNGHNVIVRPMNGADLEIAERYRYDLQYSVEEYSNAGDLTQSERMEFEQVIRQKRITLNMFRVFSRIDMPFLEPDAPSVDARRPKVEDFIKSMPASEFRELFSKVETALSELRHGLQTIYIDGKLYIEIPNVKDAVHEGGNPLTLRYPFRCRDLIPTL